MNGSSLARRIIFPPTAAGSGGWGNDAAKSAAARGYFCWVFDSRASRASAAMACGKANAGETSAGTVSRTGALAAGGLGLGRGLVGGGRNAQPDVMIKAAIDDRSSLALNVACCGMCWNV